MQFNIPQFIDKEDKIVGPFTAKHLGWMFGCGAVLLVLWNLLSFSGFIIAGIFTVGIFGTLGFYRPYNQTCLSFILSVFRFAFKPKFYLWKRVPAEKVFVTKKVTKKKKDEMQPPIQTKKDITENKIAEISKILDNY